MPYTWLFQLLIITLSFQNSLLLLNILKKTIIRPEIFCWASGTIWTFCFRSGNSLLKIDFIFRANIILADEILNTVFEFGFILEILKNCCILPSIDIMVRLLTTGPEDQGSIPGQVIPKTLKMVIDSSFIRYRTRVKWSNPGKRVAPSPSPQCSSYWKGRMWVALNYSRQVYNNYLFCLHTVGFLRALLKVSTDLLACPFDLGSYEEVGMCSFVRDLKKNVEITPCELCPIDADNHFRVTKTSK